MVRPAQQQWHHRSAAAPPGWTFDVGGCAGDGIDPGLREAQEGRCGGRVSMAPRRCMMVAVRVRSLPSIY